mmetsp:Transcript_40444/g.72671  ORF Transcript_40444/g.72671 Transcript_40444/m.72671 type:complete len:132 (-) Transcript_40444:245-640(-)
MNIPAGSAKMFVWRILPRPLVRAAGELLEAKKQLVFSDSIGHELNCASRIWNKYWNGVLRSRGSAQAESPAFQARRQTHHAPVLQIPRSGAMLRLLRALRPMCFKTACSPVWTGRRPVNEGSCKGPAPMDQ